MKYLKYILITIGIGLLFLLFVAFLVYLFEQVILILKAASL